MNTQTQETQTTQNTNQQNNTNQQKTQFSEEEIDYSYPLFKGDCFLGNEPDTKEFNTQAGKVKFHKIFHLYNYGTPEVPILRKCLIEGPPLKTSGIVTKEFDATGKNGPYKKVSHSMMFTFDLQDQECKDCLVKFDELHLAGARILKGYAGKVGLYDFDPARPGQAFPSPVYYKRDEITGEIRKGLNPTLWAKLNHWKSNKTLITDINGVPIEWESFRDVDATVIPLWHIENIYIKGGQGASAMYQIKLFSAIVVHIEAVNSKSVQGASSTLERYKAKHPGLEKKLASQLAQVRMERQDMLDREEPKPTHAILPTDGQMHQIPGKSYQGTGEADLHAFLSGAPPIQNQPVVPVQNQVPVVQSQQYVTLPVPQQQTYQPVPQPVVTQQPPQIVQQSQPVQPQLNVQPVQFQTQQSQVPQPPIQTGNPIIQIN